MNTSLYCAIVAGILSFAHALPACFAGSDRDGTRTHEAMRGAVGNLIDTEVDAFADYFASLPSLVVK